MGDKTMSDNKEENDLVQGWLDRSALNAIQMSEDENYRQLVAARATNWGKDITADKTITSTSLRNLTDRSGS